MVFDVDVFEIEEMRDCFAANVCNVIIEVMKDNGVSLIHVMRNQTGVVTESFKYEVFFAVFSGILHLHKKNHAHRGKLFYLGP